MNLELALATLDSLSENGDKLDPRFYNSVISLCISKGALEDGIRLHSHIVKIGHQPDIFLENQFLNLYLKCGDIGSALNLFNGMCRRNSVSWNVMIAGYCSNKWFLEGLHLFRMMLVEGMLPDQLTYLSALKASVGSGDPKHGQQIHSHLLKTGFLTSVRVGNALISMYAKLSNLEDAEIMYRNMVEQDMVSWNSIITANAQNGCNYRALTLFVEMKKEGLSADEFTFGGVLKTRDLMEVKQLHAQIIKSRLEDNVFVGSALLDAYAKCEIIQDAYLIFNKMSSRNIVTWNTMISVCVENDQVDKSLQLFMQMGEQGIFPDEYSLSSLFKAIATHSKIEEGKQLHALTIKVGLHTDALVGNTIITMHSKHKNVCDCQKAFESISELDCISWNAMIQMYVENEQFEQALTLFNEMKYSGFDHDEFSFVSVLAACTSLSWPRMGKAVHGNLIKMGLVPDAFVGSSLIDMYAKFGVISDAKQVFKKVEYRDLIAWNSMIVGFVQNDNGNAALKLLCSMWQENVEPDNFTFAGVLAGCADITAIQQGRQLHAMVLKSRIPADTAVANSLITMYASVGSIKEAEKVFSKLMAKNVVSWTAMVGGYAQNGYAKEAFELFEKMKNFQVKPNGITFVALLTACSHAGLTEQAKMFFHMMEFEYQITPDVEHYACMVDVLGRAGRLKEAEELINKMPHEPNALVWRMLLGASRIHGDLDRGKRSMEKILALEPGDSAAYVLLSNLYAAQGNWEGAVGIRRLMRENGVRKEPGKSWIEVQNQVHQFMAGDFSHPQANQIYSKLSELLVKMKVAGYIPQIDSYFHDIGEETT